MWIVLAELAVYSMKSIPVEYQKHGPKGFSLQKSIKGTLSPWFLQTSTFWTRFGETIHLTSMYCTY